MRWTAKPPFLVDSDRKPHNCLISLEATRLYIAFEGPAVDVDVAARDRIALAGIELERDMEPSRLIRY